MTSNQKIVIQQSKKFKFLLIRIVGLVHFTFLQTYTSAICFIYAIC